MLLETVVIVVEVEATAEVVAAEEAEVKEEAVAALVVKEVVGEEN